MKIIQMICAAFLALVLGACGGGGGDAGTPMGSKASASTGANATGTSGAITLAVIDAAGTSVTKVTFAGQTLQATYLNASGAPVKGARVAFTVTAGAGVVFSSDSALTNDQGVATIQIRSGGSSVSGVASVTATADTLTSTVNFVLSPDGSDVLTLYLLNADGTPTSSVILGGGQKIRAVYTNAKGTALEGRIVNFSIANGTAAVLGATSALTDAAGVAYIGVDALDAKTSGTVSVSASNLATTGILNFRVIGSGARTLSLALLDSQGNPTTSVGYQTGERLRALYRDSAGNPIANSRVQFLIDYGEKGVTLVPSTAPNTADALTDANGLAYIRVSASDPTASGAATVSANVGSLKSAIDFAVTADGGPTLTLTLENSASGSMPTVSYGGVQRLKAEYKSSKGKAIPNTVVTFPNVANLKILGSAITNEQGIAYASISPLSDIWEGAATVQAYVDKVVAMLNVSVKMKFSGPNKLTLSVVDKNYVPLASPAITYNGGQFIKAVYADSEGKAIPNSTVSFTVSKGKGVSVKPELGLTDADGVVYVRVGVSDATVSGAAAVQANAGTVSGDVEFAVNAPGNSELSLQLLNATGDMVSTVSDGGNQKLKVVYTDAISKLGIANTAVNFSSPSSDIVLGSGAALTDKDGIAFVDIKPRDASTAGVATVTAWVGNVVTMLNVAIKTIPPAPNVLKLELSGANGLASSSALKFGANQLLRFSYKKGDGSAIAGVRVTFAVTAGPTLASLQADSALTDADGIATVGIKSSSAVAVGAATASATVTVGTTSLSTTLDFAVAATAVNLEAFTLGSQSLAAGATTSVSIKAKAGGVAVSGVPISLSADCGSLSPAIALTNDSGQATSTYSSLKADGTSCSGSVKLSATASGSTLDAPALSVAAPVASAVNFVSASSPVIYVQGSGASTQATLKFKVLDATGAIYPNATVTAAITANPGGVGLNAAGSTAPLTLTSDSLGLVNFQIYAGTVPGPVQVKVSLNDLAYAFSSNITVQSGPPAQDRFSLSAATYNLEGQDIDGKTTTLTIRVADRQGNAVPDGTVINFTSGGGQIQPSCVTSTNNADKGISSCWVTFSSQQPRPAAQYGRVPILAFAEGVKVYADNNRNNSFDVGADTLTDMGDAYRDDNENGSYDAGEFVLPRGGSDRCPTGAGGVPARSNTCDSRTAATTVRSQIVLLMATSAAELTAKSTSSQAITFRANSVTLCGKSTISPEKPPEKCLPLANGTTFSATTSNESECTAGTPMPALVGNVAPIFDPGAQLGTEHTVFLTAADGKTCSGKTLTVMAKSPSGKVTPVNFYIPYP